MPETPITTAAGALHLGMHSRCRFCGEPISVTNFALGLGWTHTDRRSSQCLIFAAPIALPPPDVLLGQTVDDEPARPL